MKEYTNQLKELKASVPEQYSEENLQNLEKIVTQYHQIMLSIAEMEDEDNKTQYHLERIDALEDYLRNAKYGTSERQRASSFAHAKEILFEGIQALLNIIGETN